MASWSAIARRIRVPLGFAFAALYLWLASPSVKSIIIGSCLVIPGLIIRALASGYLQKNEQLATGGLYSHTRNPLYLGSLILAVGFAVAARSWWLALGLALIFIGVYLPVIRAEEAFLRDRFSHFEDYARKVPRLLPRMTGFHGEGVFSWHLYWKHREYNATLGSTAITGALIFKLLMHQ